MGAYACSRAWILAWIHSASARSLLYSFLSIAGSIIRLNQCLAVAAYFQIRRYAVWHCAVPILYSLWCGPGFKFGWKSFTNQVKSQHSHSNQLLPLCLIGFKFFCMVGGCRESLLCEQWNVVVIVTDIQNMQTKLSETTRCKI
jgi:hypothetical protein